MSAQELLLDFGAPAVTETRRERALKRLRQLRLDAIAEAEALQAVHELDQLVTLPGWRGTSDGPDYGYANDSRRDVCEAVQRKAWDILFQYFPCAAVFDTGNGKKRDLHPGEFNRRQSMRAHFSRFDPERYLARFEKDAREWLQADDSRMEVAFSLLRRAVWDGAFTVTGSRICIKPASNGQTKDDRTHGRMGLFTTHQRQGMAVPSNAYQCRGRLLAAAWILRCLQRIAHGDAAQEMDFPHPACFHHFVKRDHKRGGARELFPAKVDLPHCFEIRHFENGGLHLLSEAAPAAKLRDAFAAYVAQFAQAA